MALQIIWSPEAEETFEKIIEYLQKNWSDKEIEKFLAKTEKVLKQISSRPKMFRRSEKENIHEAIITPHNLLLYQINENNIELLGFWDTHQDPDRKPTNK